MSPDDQPTSPKGLAPYAHEVRAILKRCMGHEATWQEVDRIKDHIAALERELEGVRRGEICPHEMPLQRIAAAVSKDGELLSAHEVADRVLERLSHPARVIGCVHGVWGPECPACPDRKMAPDVVGYMTCDRCDHIVHAPGHCGVMGNVPCPCEAAS